RPDRPGTSYRYRADRLSLASVRMAWQRERSQAVTPRPTKWSRKKECETSEGPPSNCQHIDRFHDVAHEAGGIPIRCVGLDYAVAIGAAGRQTVLSRRRQRELRLPLPKSIFTFVFSQLRLTPILTAIN